MDELYVLVFGSRAWTDAKKIRDDLTKIMQDNPGKVMIVVHGDCPEGADAIAQAWYARAMLAGHNVDVKKFTPEWDAAPSRRAAGPIRNQKMVTWFDALEAEKVALGYRKGDRSNGTDGCRNLLRLAGIEPTMVER